MVGALGWSEAAQLAKQVEGAGFAGMLFTETGQTPWMSIAAAAMAAPSLQFSTGIAVAFPRSPMVSAAIAWELAGNTGGRFRLGLGSQVRAHIERRYGSEFDPPGPRLRDYVLAVKDTLAAFRGERKLAHDGPYYKLLAAPRSVAAADARHGDIKVDISAVGPWMATMAGEVADGVHVHPLHSLHYLEHRLLPAVRRRRGAGRTRRGRGRPADPRVHRRRRHDRGAGRHGPPGTDPDRASTARRRTTPSSSTTSASRDVGPAERAPQGGRPGGLAATITDEMFDVFAIVGRWDEIADRVVERYAGVAARVISYMTVEDVARTRHLGRWGEIAQAVGAA